MKRPQSENAVFSIARTRCQETQCSLFPIYSRIPKLDVAGLGCGTCRLTGGQPNALSFRGKAVVGKADVCRPCADLDPLVQCTMCAHKQSAGTAERLSRSAFCRQVGR